MTKLEELKAADDAAGEAFDVALADAFESGLDNQAALNAAFDAYDACLAERYKEQST
jgi:hypothetical protein